MVSLSCNPPLSKSTYSRVSVLCSCTALLILVWITYEWTSFLHSPFLLWPFLMFLSPLGNVCFPTACAWTVSLLTKSCAHLCLYVDTDKHKFSCVYSKSSAWIWLYIVYWWSKHTHTVKSFNESVLLRQEESDMWSALNRTGECKLWDKIHTETLEQLSLSKTH